MKKIYLCLIVILLTLQSFSQDFKYSGPMNESVFNKMTAFEKILYVDCLKELDVENDSIVWISEKTLNKIQSRKNYYFSIQVSTDNVTEMKDKKVVSGRHRLPVSEFMISINRKKNLSEISVTVYY